MAYKYLTAARINSTIKKFGVKLDYTKGGTEFRLVDLKTDEVVKTLTLPRLHSLSIDEWRAEASSARGSVADGYNEAELSATQKVARKVRKDAEEVRKLVETWDEALEAVEEERLARQA